MNATKHTLETVSRILHDDFGLEVEGHQLDAALSLVNLSTDAKATLRTYAALLMMDAVERNELTDEDAEDVRDEARNLGWDV